MIKVIITYVLLYRHKQNDLCITLYAQTFGFKLTFLQKFYLPILFYPLNRGVFLTSSRRQHQSSSQTQWKWMLCVEEALFLALTLFCSVHWKLHWLNPEVSFTWKKPFTILTLLENNHTQKNSFMQLHKKENKRAEREKKRLLFRTFLLFPNWPNKNTALLTNSHSRRFRSHIVIMPLDDQLSDFLTGWADLKPGLLQFWPKKGFLELLGVYLPHHLGEMTDMLWSKRKEFCKYGLVLTQIP